VQADLWGHQSHGVLRLSWYAARLKAGVCNPIAHPEIVVDAGAIAVIDGKHAIRRAKIHGIGAVGLRNSNHFGTVGGAVKKPSVPILGRYFTLMGPPEGCVAFLSTNALDIANTGVARGKIYLARQKGQLIPEGWAINAAGAPTRDPQEAIDGIILPMAQHKGYAIAVMMDMLSGVLTGSAFGRGVYGPYQTAHRSGAGQLMIAINIESIQPLAEFNGRMEQLVAELKSVPLAQGFQEVLYPGEMEARNDTKNRANGLALPEDTLADLRGLAEAHDLKSVLPF
jgi:LDH2 family malate/lactate/ureidoglycolate dehydrogenase